VQEAAVMQVVGRLDSAALEQHLRGTQAGFCAGRLKGFGFRLVAVRRVEQGISQDADLGRQAERLQLVNPAFHRERLLTLFFKAGQSSCENVGRRFAEAALAFAMEIDGRGMHGKQHRRRLERAWLDVRSNHGQNQETKIRHRSRTPKGIPVRSLRPAARPVQAMLKPSVFKAQDDCCRLDLATLAGGHFDLQRTFVVSHDTAGLEAAIFFKQYIHLRIITQRIQ
jgi:hypothetical protein